MASREWPMYSSSRVKSGLFRSFTPWVYVILSNRRVATPRVARPNARSLNGLAQPTLESWSLGPEPGSMMRHGCRPGEVGRVNVPRE
jgi:hypothetical protein